MKSNSIYKAKKVLVAGSAGFIGGRLVAELVNRGACVRGVFREKIPNPKIQNVEYVCADLTTRNDCLAVTEGVDFVFMAAAVTSGAAVIENQPLQHLNPNLIMNTLMLEAAHTNMVKRFCFISSNVVYPVSEAPMKESDASYEFFRKYHIVGWMKRFSEVLCEIYSDRVVPRMPTLIIRPGNLYGPFDKFSDLEAKVIPSLIKRASNTSDHLVVWGDGRDIKDFLYIDDFIDALLLVFEKAELPLVINIASGESVTINHVVENILNILGRSDLKVLYDHRKPTMIPIRKIDTGLLRAEFGWRPKIGLYQGLSQTIDWYKNHLHFRNGR